MYALYNSFNSNNSIIINNNTIISNNNNEDEEYLTIKVDIDTSHKSSYRMQHAYFELWQCEFSFNKAKSSHFIVQYLNEIAEQTHTDVIFALKLTSTIVRHNKAVKS